MTDSRACPTLRTEDSSDEPAPARPRRRPTRAARDRRGDLRPDGFALLRRPIVREVDLLRPVPRPPRQRAPPRARDERARAGIRPGEARVELCGTAARVASDLVRELPRSRRRRAPSAPGLR